MRTATFSATKRQVASSVMRVWSMAALKSNCSRVLEERKPARRMRRLNFLCSRRATSSVQTAAQN